MYFRTDGKRQTSCKHTTRTMIFCPELRFIIVSQGIPENRDNHSSPPGISSSIAVKGNENQEAFNAPLVKGGALFLFRHSRNVFTSHGSVITAITFTTGNPHKRDSLASLGRLQYQWHLRHFAPTFRTYQQSAAALTTGTPFGRTTGTPSLRSVAWLRRHLCIPAHRVHLIDFLNKPRPAPS
jgi:hypothetical protein